MKVLFIGDIFGEIGRKMVATYLPLVKEKYQVDVVFANGENTTHGKGLIKKHYEELLNDGIALITMGNHTYSKREIFDYIDEASHLIVPLNRPKALPGVGSRVIVCGDKRIRVTNLLGLTFMDPKSANPFEVIEPLLEEDTSDIHIIDFHGETTSDKAAFGYFVDGRVTAVVGTHTHVPTADEHILPKGTAFQSDIGMTGPYVSVIGCQAETIIERNLKGIMTPFALAKGEGQFLATLLTIDESTNQCTHIERIQIDPQHPGIL